MLRSTAVPGWGQIYNHKLIKAAVVMGGEGILISKAVSEFRKEQDAAERGDEDGKNTHYNLKVNYIWWAVAVHLLQMADAFVDAHLARFDADFGPEGSRLGRRDLPLGEGPRGPSFDERRDPGFSVAVRFHF